jgi:hypothetical protein
MIPNLPFFAMAKRGKHWHKVVERAVAYNRGLSESLLELSLAEHKFAIFEANRRRYDRNPTHLGRG